MAHPTLALTKLPPLPWQRMGAVVVGVEEDLKLHHDKTHSLESRCELVSAAPVAAMQRCGLGVKSVR